MLFYLNQLAATQDHSYLTTRNAKRPDGEGPSKWVGGRLAVGDTTDADERVIEDPAIREAFRLFSLGMSA